VRVLVATRNPIKLEEIRHFLPPAEVFDVDLLEVQAVAPAEVVAHKLDQVAALRLPDPVLVEDTGLALAAWHGLPGALVKWFVDELGPAGVTASLRDDASRDAVATSAVGVTCAGRRRVWEASVAGRIVAPRGSLGGWTPVFEVAGTGRTLAEMSLPERLRHTMRREPLLAAARWLAEQGRDGRS
jgi:non-canonical purine NTP pyrophosphatase (RdgB/HAM1 family)